MSLPHFPMMPRYCQGHPARAPCLHALFAGFEAAVNRPIPYMLRQVMELDYRD
jgi:hypothetical protein